MKRYAGFCLFLVVLLFCPATLFAQGSYTKISNSGNQLPESAQLGYGPNDWACTLHNATGLMWEVKVDDPNHLRYEHHRYGWYFSNTPGGNPIRKELEHICNYSLEGNDCNTENYASSVNSMGLCGYKDWAVPSIEDLETLIVLGSNPTINTYYFPENLDSIFWSSSPNVDNSDFHLAWYMSLHYAWHVAFRYGNSGISNRNSAFRVRLARDGQTGPPPAPIDMNDSRWITSFYVAYWGRAGDPGGIDYWLGEVNREATSVPGVAENFALSDEAKAMYPYFNSPEAATDAERTAFVQAVYQNLLNRNVLASDEGVLYWVGELRTNRTTPGLVIGNMIHAAIQANPTDWLTIWNKVQVAEYFTQRFEASGRTWQDGDFDLARQALQDVTDDPDTVETGKGRVDQMLQ